MNLNLNLIHELDAAIDREIAPELKGLLERTRRYLVIVEPANELLNDLLEIEKSKEEAFKAIFHQTVDQLLQRRPAPVPPATKERVDAVAAQLLSGIMAQHQQGDGAGKVAPAANVPPSSTGAPPHDEVGYIYATYLDDRMRRRGELLRRSEDGLCRWRSLTGDAIDPSRILRWRKAMGSEIAAFEVEVIQQQNTPPEAPQSPPAAEEAAEAPKVPGAMRTTPTQAYGYQRAIIDEIAFLMICGARPINDKACPCVSAVGHRARTVETHIVASVETAP